MDGAYFISSCLVPLGPAWPLSIGQGVACRVAAAMAKSRDTRVVCSRQGRQRQRQRRQPLLRHRADFEHEVRAWNEDQTLGPERFLSDLSRTVETSGCS